MGVRVTRFFVLGLISSIIVSCASYRNVALPGYDKKKISGKTLVIAPYSNRPSIDYSGNVKPEFGKGNKDTLIYCHFSETFPRCIEKYSSFSSVRHDAFTSQLELVKRLYMFGSDSVFLLLPKDGSFVSTKNGNADFVLFMQDITLGTSTCYVPGGGSMVMMNGGGGMTMVGRGGGSSSGNLGYSANYTFWDNDKKCPAVIGRAKVNTRPEGFWWVQFNTIKQWNDIDSCFAKSAIDSTPFAK
jgi:hypothetical protein